MKQQFFSDDNLWSSLVDNPIEYYEWASFVTRVEGGYIAFESESDFVTWSNQK